MHTGGCPSGGARPSSPLAARGVRRTVYSDVRSKVRVGSHHSARSGEVLGKHLLGGLGVGAADQADQAAMWISMHRALGNAQLTLPYVALPSLNPRLPVPHPKPRSAGWLSCTPEDAQAVAHAPAHRWLLVRGVRCTVYSDVSSKVRARSHHNLRHSVACCRCYLPLACPRICPYPPLVSRRRPPAPCAFPCRHGIQSTSVESSIAQTQRSCGGRVTAASWTAMALS